MFDRWADRVAAVNEEDGRRALLAEIALARARQLGDVPAAREATWAIARLHQLLGDDAKAVSEAQQLASLCRTPPRAPKGQTRAASELLASLGQAAPSFSAPARESKRDTRRDGKRERKPAERGAGRGAKKDDPLLGARAAAADGKTRNLRTIAGDRRGPTWSGFRAWSLLADAQRDHSSDAEKLLGAVEAAMAQLADGLGVKMPVSDPLSELIGEPLPSKRRAQLTVLERWVEAHGDRLGELVVAAIDHQQAQSGGSASWLSGLLGRALSEGDEAAKAKLATVVAQPAFQSFDAWGFHRAVRLATAALADGWSFAGLREGVLPRGEPADRRVWTLRLARDGADRMVAIAPHATSAWPDGVAEKLGERLVRLSRATVLVASGAGNAAFRTAATRPGVTVLDEDADDASLLAALIAVEPVEAPARPEKAAAPEAAAPKEPAGPTPPQVLAELLAGDTPPSEEQLVEVIRTFRRPGSALRVAERANASLELAPALLRAVHTVEEAGRSLPEGTTLAVRAAAGGVEGVRDLLSEGELAARFGGEGLDVLCDMAEILVGDGWELFRVLRGPTRREQSDHPVLDTLAEGLTGLWRLLVRKGETKGEVWYVASLSAEGRAGVPQLLLADHQRAVVLPIEPDLLAWYGTLEGPPAIGWEGADSAEALRGAVQGWTA